MTPEEFKAAVKELGWNWEEACEKLQKSPGTIKAYKAGVRTNSHRAIPPSVVDDINKHLAFGGKTPAARREPLSSSTGPSRAIAALEVELKNRNAIISKQGERIEDLLRSVAADDDTDYVEQIIKLEELCEKFQGWCQNAQARLTTATHANPSPFKDWTGKEWPPLFTPPVYIPAGEDTLVSDDQRPEGEWNPA